MRVDVKIVESKESNAVYPSELFMDLSTDKIQALGWKATVSLQEMFHRMIATMER